MKLLKEAIRVSIAAAVAYIVFSIIAFIFAHINTSIYYALYNYIVLNMVIPALISLIFTYLFHKNNTAAGKLSFKRIILYDILYFAGSSILTCLIGSIVIYIMIILVLLAIGYRG